MNSSTCRLIILKKVKYGESDLIITGLSHDGVVRSFIAKSALKSKKRFGGGVLEPTHHVSVIYSFKGGSHEEGLFVLNEAQVIDGFPKLRQDYEKLSTALYLLKLVSLFLKEGESFSQGAFNLLGYTLKALEECESCLKLKTHFEVKFLSLQGVFPHETEYKKLLTTSVREHKSVYLTDLEWAEASRQSEETIRLITA